MDHCYSSIKPFLRWAGGKSKIVGLLAQYLPPIGSYDRYFEPFLGAGALFFFLGPNKAVLSDLNRDLINCYKQVAKNPTRIGGFLKTHRELNNKDYYYLVRSQNPKTLTPLEQAARFIYLNKAAFNGIYRVNRRGKFNVPYGPSVKGPALPDGERLRDASSLLKNAELLVGDYREICSMAKRGDFIYLDPPYPPTNGTACFTHYTPNRFGWRDQEEVSKVFRKLDKKGCLVMMSNSDRKRIRLMFNGFYTKRLRVTRWLGSNGNRFKVHELVVTNYNPIEV